MIAVCWVPKGASNIVPDVPDPAENEEVEGASEISENEEHDEEMADIGDPKEEVEEDEVVCALAAVEALGKTKGSSSLDEVQIIANQLNELMKDYDKEDDVPDCIGAGEGNLYYASNEMGPYLQEGDDEDEDEIDDVIIKTTDAVVVSACTTEDDYSYLEVSIYEDSEGGDPNMYTHQEKILSAYSLCTTWLDFKPKSRDKGSFIAVGSMEPAIEIWDLNLVKEEQPIIVLGGKLKKLKEGKKAPVKYKKALMKILYSVLHGISISGMSLPVEVLTIRSRFGIWRMQNVLQLPSITQRRFKQLHGVCVHQSYFSVVLLIKPLSWSVSAVVESLAWDPHNEHSFLLLATASSDEMVKLWDLTNNQPSCVASKNFKCGQVFSIAFSEDNPSLLAVGGKKGGLTVWDILSEPGAAQSFHKNSKQKTTNKMQTT